MKSLGQILFEIWSLEVDVFLYTVRWLPHKHAVMTLCTDEYVPSGCIFPVGVHPPWVYIPCGCTSPLGAHPQCVYISCGYISPVGVHHPWVYIPCGCKSPVSVHPLWVYIPCGCTSSVGVHPICVYIPWCVYIPLYVTNITPICQQVGCTTYWCTHSLAVNDHTLFSTAEGFFISGHFVYSADSFLHRTLWWTGCVGSEIKQYFDHNMEC